MCSRRRRLRSRIGKCAEASDQRHWNLEKTIQEQVQDHEPVSYVEVKEKFVNIYETDDI
jgi:hypothetical protein